MRNNKTIKKLEKLGCDIKEIPEYLLDSAYEIVSSYGIGMALEIGFILSEDLNMIRDLSEVIPAIKIVTSKVELLEMRDIDGDDHVGFTHINPYLEDNVFYCLYVIPYKYACENL